MDNFTKEHGVGLDLFGPNAGEPESIRKLAAIIAEEATGELSDKLIAALGAVAIAYGEARAEARGATQREHVANATAKENWRARDAAQARANNAEARIKSLEEGKARLLEDSLILAAESDERGDVLDSIVAAVRLATEKPEERRERLRLKLAGKESGNA